MSLKRRSGPALALLLGAGLALQGCSARELAFGFEMTALLLHGCAAVQAHSAPTTIERRRCAPRPHADLVVVSGIP